MAAHQGCSGRLTREFDEVEQLGDAIQAIPSASGHILIDGFHGVGKSTLAVALANYLDLPILEADHFVKHQIGATRNRYIDTLDYDAFKAALTPIPSCVIDGVSALDIADYLAVSVKAHIYVKHLDHHGYWCERREVEIENEIDSFAEPNALLLCLRRYHWDRKPQIICDAVFLRQDPE